MPVASAKRSDTESKRPLLRPDKDRRRSKRVAIEIEGRYLAASGEERTLKTIDFSCGGALIASEAKPETGSQLICYFDEIGRITSTVVRHTPEGFAVRFKTSQHKRDKIADRLTWLVNKETLDLVDERSSKRINVDGAALVKCENGRTLQCRVVDISLTGAGFETSAAPPLVGEKISVGNIIGTVVRSANGSFGICFETAFGFSPADD